MATGTIKSVIPRSDIVDNLTTNDSTKVLSAAQGKALSEHLETHSVSGTESVAVPSSAKDLNILVRYGTSGGMQALTFTYYIPIIDTNTSALTLTQGYYLSSSSYGFCQITTNKNNNTVSIVSLIINGTDYKTTSTVTVYYKQ